VWSLGTADPIARGRFEVIGRGLAISADGSRLATSQMGETLVRLWSLPDLSEIQTWNLEELGCWDLSCALAFTPDGGHLVVAGWKACVVGLLCLSNVASSWRRDQREGRPAHRSEYAPGSYHRGGVNTSS
jgi:WD40 repeat protein